MLPQRRTTVTESEIQVTERSLLHFSDMLNDGVVQ